MNRAEQNKQGDRRVRLAEKVFTALLMMILATSSAMTGGCSTSDLDDLAGDQFAASGGMGGGGMGGGGMGGDPPPPGGDFTMVFADADSGALFAGTDDGAQRAQLTTHSGGGPSAPADASPTYSHAGDRIAFMHYPDRGFLLGELRTIQPDGTGQTTIASLNAAPFPYEHNTQQEDTISWSANDREIVFVYSTGIFAVEIATGNVRELLQLGGTNRTPVDVDISPVRGEMVLFVNRDIFRLPFDDSSGLIAPLSFANAIPVSADPARELYPRFSRDGAKIAYIRDPSQLIVHDIATGAETVVASGVFSELAWSPDGSTIFFRQTISSKNTEIQAVNVATGTVTNVTNTSRDREVQVDRSPMP